MLAAIIIPIIANGIRAWGTIYIAQSQGVEFAAGFDHIFYGWIFFAIVVVLVLFGAWRFFEREPEEYGWTIHQVDALPFASMIGSSQISPLRALSLIAALIVGVGIAAAIVASPSIG